MKGKRQNAVLPKSEIRNEMRERRKALSADERARRSLVICEKLSKAVSQFKAEACADKPCLIAVYLASSREIDLTPFILEMLDSKVALAAPRWNGETYQLAELKSLSPRDLRHGPMNILEPAADKTILPQSVDIWIVPGLAFTANGARLGYGGGWYDRLLAASDPSSVKMGVAHAFQIVESLPAEAHDIMLERIVTE